MRVRGWRASLVLCAWVAAQAAVPAPQEHLGFRPGDDYKLADTAQIYGYFQKLAASSDRIRLMEFGKSSLGRPMYVAFLSAPENLKKLDRYREISRRLALGEPAEAEARALAEEGRAIVWIDSGLHATEVAPVQQAPELAYRILTGESPEVQAIRREVILLQVPVINPDGLDMVAHWYAKNVGTPYELAPLPWLYQKYAGHDNNRDYFMLNLDETRNVTRMLFREWFPQIVYNQHQSPTFPARIFVPPYAEPLNPHIPAAVTEGINRIGAAMRDRFAREDKPGVLSYWGYDAWWNGGLRSAPAFHNMHGILTETALYGYATPRVYQLSELGTTFPNGMPTREPSIFYSRPWLGGKWGVRDAIEYMLTADFAILEAAAERRADYLLKSYRMARAAIETGARGKPYAYIVASRQWDLPASREMLERLWLAGVQVRVAAKPFKANGRSYPHGTAVLPAAQPFRPYLVDLMEPQKYPELRAGANGPTKRPYDIAGWTLSMQMGVAVDRVDEPFDAELEPLSEFGGGGGVVRGSGRVLQLDHRENGSFLATAALLESGARVRWSADGAIAVEGGATDARQLADRFGVSASLAGDAPQPAWELRRPRVALYQPWSANSDQGWTEWLLDRFRVPRTLVHNQDFAGDLRARFDTIILAAQSAASILHGAGAGGTGRGPGPPFVQRPEYSGGIGIAGLLALHDFVRGGGTLIALDTATELPIQYFPLPVRNVLRSSGEAGGAAASFYCPGSLVRITVDRSHPLAFGMPENAVAFSTGGQAFEFTPASAEGEVRSVVRFAARDLLASGWVSGERAVLGKHAMLDARFGSGRVVLFGFRPQFRGQPHGTFKLLLNAIYLGSAQKL